MKKMFTKVLVGIFILSMCLTVTPISASAVSTYLRGDINGDGTVDIRDSTAFIQYLNGIVGAAANASDRLDVNRDYVIDSNDHQIVKNIIVGIDTTTAVQYKNTSMTTTQSSTTYCVYNAKTGFKTSEYTLDTVSNLSPSAISPYSIIGTDDRYVDYSKLGLVKFSTGGTGIIVGNNTILTAAHCVYEATDLKYTIYEVNHNQQNIEIGTYNVVKSHVPKNYTLGNNTQNNDYAIVTVSEDLTPYIGFELGVCRDYFKNTNHNIYITGYTCGTTPSTSGEQLNPLLSNKFVTGTGTTTYIDSKRLKYNVDTFGGTSGSPVYITQNNKNIVIGIHTNGDYSLTANSGRRIDTNILHFVYNNPAL